MKTFLFAVCAILVAFTLPFWYVLYAIFRILWSFICAVKLGIFGSKELKPINRSIRYPSHPDFLTGDNSVA